MMLATVPLGVTTVSMVASLGTLTATATVAANAGIYADFFATVAANAGIYAADASANTGIAASAAAVVVPFLMIMQLQQ